ncbi:MAG: YukJ family protein [Janthinobacterium lividum]
MPIQSYSLLKGTPTAGKVVSGASAHYQITVQATGGPFTVAVNIQSVDGSEVLYAIKPNFTPPMPLTAVPSGIEKLASRPGSLALDFVREMIAGKPMIQRSEMALLPIAQNTAHFVAEVEKHDRLHEQKQHALSNAVVALLNQAMSEHGSLVYAFGSAFADSGVTDGIHDIHMNQGNALNNHGGDNGIWQDGALFIYLPKEKSYTAVFIAFQNESWHTDNSGNPAA